MEIKISKSSFIITIILNVISNFIFAAFVHNYFNAGNYTYEVLYTFLGYTSISLATFRHLWKQSKIVRPLDIDEKN